MKAQTIGRVLGVGVRVAGRVAGQHLAGPAQGAASAAAIRATPPTRDAGRAAGHAGRRVAKGIGGFLRPFGRVGAIVWLEVVGVFFLLPVIVFAPMVWHTRTSWMNGPDHRKFLSAAAVVIVFLYLGITSFVRAHRRAAHR